jgi:hypothetical protein
MLSDLVFWQGNPSAVNVTILKLLMLSDCVLLRHGTKHRSVLSCQLLRQVAHTRISPPTVVLKALTAHKACFGSPGQPPSCVPVRMLLLHLTTLARENA